MPSTRPLEPMHDLSGSSVYDPAKIDAEHARLYDLIGQLIGDLDQTTRTDNRLTNALVSWEALHPEVLALAQGRVDGIVAHEPVRAVITDDTGASQDADTATPPTYTLSDVPRVQDGVMLQAGDRVMVGTWPSLDSPTWRGLWTVDSVGTTTCSMSRPADWTGELGAGLHAIAVEQGIAYRHSLWVVVVDEDGEGTVNADAVTPLHMGSDPRPSVTVGASLPAGPAEGDIHFIPDPTLEVDSGPTSGDGGTTAALQAYVDPSPLPDIGAVQTGYADAVAWLRDEVRRVMRRIWIFNGGDYGGNFYNAYTPFDSLGGGAITLNAYSPHPSPSREVGLYELEIVADLSTATYAGVNFEAGTLSGGAPTGTGGNVAGARVDLTGAEALHLVLRSASGQGDIDVQVKIGFDGGTDPDSVLHDFGFQTIGEAGTELSLDVSTLDMSAVNFGLTLAVNDTSTGTGSFTFYLSNAYYDFGTTNKVDRGFIQSWEMLEPANEFDVIIQNSAFTYDQALAAIVLIQAGHIAEATFLLQGLCHGVLEDVEYTDDRIRNAYKAGPSDTPPGWGLSYPETPGWYGRDGFGDAGVYSQDDYALSTYIGSAAWVILALLIGDQAGIASTPEDCLSCAQALGDWCLDHQQTTHAAGFSGGVQYSWEDEAASDITWRSTEHNADLVPVFRRLFAADGAMKWARAADSARRFLGAMWTDDGEGASYYYTGTAVDGSTINETPLPLDATLWPYYGARLDDAMHQRSIDWVVSVLTDDTSGLPKYSDAGDGGWIEGAGQMATAYHHSGHRHQADQVLSVALSYQRPDGSFESVTEEQVDTGFGWLYFGRGHVGATSWFAIGAASINPFWWLQ